MRNALFIAMAVSVLTGCLLAEDAVAGPNPATAGAAPGARAEKFVLSGYVVAADGEPIAKAEVQLGSATARTDAQGSFQLLALSGESKISISASGYTPLSVPVLISADTNLKFELQLSATTTVSVQVDSPISAALTQIFESDELPQAQPGQPGVPVALPGYPSETASGGVKAPQYFALVWQEITASRSPNIFALAISCFPTIYPPTRTATVMPIPICLYRMRSV